VKRLGVNIDHIATLRNARGEKHPDPCYAANEVVKMGADSVTIHLREDRRHINDLDAKKICNLKNIFVNLEVSMNTDIIKKALKIKPNYICIVPENRKEITTEGGLNLENNKKKLKEIIQKFKKAKIRTSLFINPSLKDIRLSKKLNVDCVEIHTGKISSLVKSKKNYNLELIRIKKSSYLANELNMEVHAGHGLDYKTTRILSKIDIIKEFNIGHFLIGESIFNGLSNVIKNFKKIIKNNS
jgi:pyridoxine 5-phosphate synthase